MAVRRARPLFAVAAIFNILVSLGILFAYDLVGPWLGFPPQPAVWIHIIALVVLVFGYAYWRVARDPARFREYVVLATEGAEGMSLFANWNKSFIPDFKGTPLDELFPNYIEPFLAAFRAQLVASGELPPS